MGSRFRKSRARRTVHLRATANPDLVENCDLAIVFVKSTHTGDAALTARKITSRQGLVLTLQNGMGNADRIAQDVDPMNVIAGTTSYGATMLGPGKIRHAGVGLTTIGMWLDGEKEKAKEHLSASLAISSEYTGAVEAKKTLELIQQAESEAQE